MTVTTTQSSSRSGRSVESMVHPSPMRRRARDSAHGEVRVTLHRNDCGVVLVRDEHRLHEPRVVVVAAFTQSSSFEDWCAGDPLRFSAPIVLEQVRRDVEAVLRGDL